MKMCIVAARRLNCSFTRLAGGFKATKVVSKHLNLQVKMAFQSWNVQD